MTFEEIITTFDLKSDDFNISLMLPQALAFDIQNYNYYLKLLNVEFTNVVPNVQNDLYINVGGSDVLIVGKGIYDITQLIEAYNTVSANSNNAYGELKLNSFTGKVTLTNSSGGTLSFTNLGNRDFLTNKVIGFDASQLTSIPNAAITTANNVVVIQDFNYFVLTSQNIMGNTYTGNSQNSQMKIANILYTFSSAIQPFKMKNWVAIMPLLFKIEASTFEYISFQIRTGNGEEINDLMDVSGFHIFCQIVRQHKL